MHPKNYKGLAFIFFLALRKYRKIHIEIRLKLAACRTIKTEYISQLRRVNEGKKQNLKHFHLILVWSCGLLLMKKKEDFYRCNVQCLYIKCTIAIHAIFDTQFLMTVLHWGSRKYLIMLIL